MDYKKPLIVVVIGLVLLITAVAGFSAYQKYFLTPEKIISQAMGNIMKTTSFEYTGDWNAGFVKLKFSGASDIGERPDKKYWLRLTMKLGATVSTGFEYRQIDQSIYLRTGQGTNSFAGITTPPSDWIKVDRSEIIERFEEAQKETSGSTPASLRYLMAEATDAQNAEKKKLFAQSELFTVTEVLKEGKINGKDSLHYAIAIESDELKRVLFALGEIDGMPYTDEEQAELERTMDVLGEIKGEIWIGKKERLPYKLILKTEEQENDMVGQVVSIPAGDMTPERIEQAPKSEGVAPKSPGLQFTISFKNFNKPVKTSAPKNIQASNEEFLNQILENARATQAR